LDKLAVKYGNEPVCIIEIDWFSGPISYADKYVQPIPGKIVELGDLDDVVNVSNNSGSQELTVVLDDTDGSIKAILDTHDVHKRPVRVYQYFTGLDLADKFLLFSGKLNTPITWNERDRTVTVTIVSQLEDREVGFSAEEGNFPYLPADLVGKAWPMIFGKVLNSPCLRVNQSVTGTTLNGIGIVSGANHWAAVDDSDVSQFLSSLVLQQKQKGHLLQASSCWQFVNPVLASNLLDQSNRIAESIAQALNQYQAQKVCEAANKATQIATQVSAGDGGSTINILGGEDFPQNQTVTLNINGGLFTGTFNGSTFTIYERNHIENEALAATIAATRSGTCSQPPQPQNYKFETQVPCGSPCEIGGGVDCLLITEGIFIPAWPSTNSNAGSSNPVAQQFWADAGSSVSIYGSEPLTYIVSITPGTVLTVRAYKQFEGRRALVDLPPNLYSVVSQNYGPITAVQVVLTQQLSQITGQGWDDDLFVTFESTIGPNITHIYEYLLTNYSDLTPDTVTFSDLHTKLAKYPANFGIYDRRNILAVLQEMAFQSRCALWVSNGVVYLKYLPEVPTVVDTITVSDLDAEAGVVVDLTPTEDLVTKMLVSWRVSLEGFTVNDTSVTDRLILLRHNVKKYGVQEQSYDWYMFNQPDIVYKMATFWLIRNSITWKTLKFKTFLNHLNLETFDAVTLDLPYVSTNPVTAVVTSASYNSVDNCVDISCVVPVEAGTMTVNPFYWPSALPVTTTWPTQADIESGNAGGGGLGTGATGNLPIGDTSWITLPGRQVVIVGGPNVMFESQSDWGDSTPTDTDFVAQPIIDTSVYAELTNSTRPSLNLQIQVPKPYPVLGKPESEAGSVTIDIRKTKVTDSDHPSEDPAYLDSIFLGIINANVPSGRKLVIDRINTVVGDSEHPEGQPLSDVLKNADGYLAIRTDVSIWDQTDGEHEFDFKYDETGGKFGAGTAFLKDV
jgi:hypothetical protein